MSDLGLCITHKDGSSASLPSSKYPAASPASSSTPQGGSVFEDSLRRPASALAMSSSIMSGDSLMKLGLSSSPVKSDFKIPSRPDTAFSDQGLANVVPYSTPFVIKPSSSSLAFNSTSFSPRARIESRNPLPSYANVSLYISQMEREVSARPKPRSEAIRSLLHVDSEPANVSTYSTLSQL